MKWLPCLALYLCAVSTYAQPLPALIPYYNGAAWGYCDSNKKIKIQPQWYEAGLFYDGRAIVKAGRKDSFTHALINAKGEYIIPPERRWNGELATPPQVLQLNARNAAGKWGLIDSVNNVLIPFLYDVPKGYPFRAFFTRRPAWDKLFMVVTKDGKKGVVDSANNTLIPFIYDDIWMSGGTDGMAFRYDSTVFFKVWKDGKAGIIDTAGREIIPCVYDALYYDINVRQQPPFLITRKNGRMGAIDWQQQVLVPFAYDSVKAVDNIGLQFYTFQDDKRGYIDRSRKLEIQPLYDGVEPQDDTYIVVKVYDDKRSKYKNGLYNTKGKLLVKPKYDNLHVQNGNIIVTKYDGEVIKTNTLNKTTYLRNGPWKKYKLSLDGFDILNEPVICGTGRANMRSMPVHPHMPGKNFGEKVYRFNKDGIDYNVVNYVQMSDSISDISSFHQVKYFAVAGRKGAQQYYAVVDRDSNYIIRPQSRYRPMRFLAGRVSTI